MKAITTAIVFFLLVSLHLLSSCERCPSGPNSTNVFDSGLFFDLENEATGENLLNLFNGPYNRDTVKLLREDLTKESTLQIYQDGRTWFKCLTDPDDLAGLTKKVSKSFYLYLNRFDTDTIRIEFTLEEGPCPSPDFKQVEVFFNGKLNTSGSGISTGSRNRIQYQTFKKSI